MSLRVARTPNRFRITPNFGLGAGPDDAGAKTYESYALAVIRSGVHRPVGAAAWEREKELQRRLTGSVCGSLLCQ